jgi:microsomal dipeptidase-like Zn-dependent dipeptidase
MIGKGEGQIDGVVMVTFVPEFTTDKGVNASAAGVADHIEYISDLIGKKQCVVYTFLPNVPCD